MDQVGFVENVSLILRTSHPHKKRRLHEVFNPHASHQTHQESSLFQPNPASPLTSYLDVLPAEILLMILDYSLEASLIHTCHRLWQSLPAYVPYTKNLALKALSVTPTCNAFESSLQGSRPSQNAIQNAPLQFGPHLNQTQLKEIVFSSFWFGEPQLKQTRRELFKNAVMQACALVSLEEPGATISKWQLRKIQRFAKSFDSSDNSDDLTLRLNTDSGHKIYLRGAPDFVIVTRPFPATDLSVPVLDFGTRIPSQLFCQPVTAFKLTMLNEFCTYRYWGRRMPVECDHAVLTQALFDSIATDKTSTLETLLKIESRIMSGSSTTLVGIEHVEKAMKIGDPRKLTKLLDHSWEWSKGTNITEIQLQNAIDETRNWRYSNWLRTTKAVAMEIATRWKIAEIERSGGTALRHMGKWPPFMTITEPGCIFPRTWYIPVEGNDDLLVSS